MFKKSIITSKSNKNPSAKRQAFYLIAAEMAIFMLAAIVMTVCTKYIN